MKKIVLGIVGAVVVVILIAGAWLYTGTLNESKAKVFKQLSLPVALVGSQPISGAQFLKRVELADTLYQEDEAYDATQAKSDILSQLIDDAKLSVITTERGIKVDAAEVESQYRSIIDQFAAGDEDKFKEILDQTYHLTPEQFRTEVIANDILRSNLTVWYNQQKDLNQDAYAQLQKLQDLLAQGQSFEDVVKTYTEDEATKDFGGDIGLVKLSELAPEFVGPLENAKAGDTVQVISRFGLHIVKVTDVDKSTEEPSYHLQQVFVQIPGFEDWYNKEAEQIRSRQLVKF